MKVDPCELDKQIIPFMPYDNNSSCASAMIREIAINAKYRQLQNIKIKWGQAALIFAEEIAIKSAGWRPQIGIQQIQQTYRKLFFVWTKRQWNDNNRKLNNNVESTDN